MNRFRGDLIFSLEGLLVAWARAGFDGHGIEATAVLQEVVPRGAFETMALPELMVEANIAEPTGDKLQSGQVVRFEIAQDLEQDLVRELVPASRQV